MALRVNKLINANLYSDGNNLLGRVLEATLPEMTTMQAEHNALGMVGVIETFAGFEKMEVELKLSSFYSDMWKQLGDVTKSHSLQLMGNLEGWEANGLASQNLYRVVMSARAKNVPAGSFTSKENAGFTMRLACDSLKIEENKVEIFYFNAFTNEYRVNGNDVLTSFKNNTGAF